MKPIAIFRHTATEGPGYFADYLRARGLAYRLVRVDQGEPVPEDPRRFSGLAFMGGPMSVNDPLPWIPPSLALIRAAVAADVPVLGHCLGGQLMAKALGAVVAPNPVKEIGWGAVRVADDPVARHWFGDLTEFETFHWHGETFAIPPGGTRILGNGHCANQAFALGRHLGMQCHVEMTQSMIHDWSAEGAEEIRSSAGPAVQAPAAMAERLDERVRALQAVAARVYGRWVEGLA